ncbi:MAG: DUF4249 domain-containing protein [Chitinophagaceae bacterium]|nr:DUF4249 domain-containing protein [Chitinophagaceae bacterium]
MNKQHFLIGILFFISSGCTKDYTIHPKDAKPLYVIEGRISNMRGPYYVRVTKSQNAVEKGTDSVSWVDNAEAVKGALVVISDDMGTMDTLMPVDPNGERYGYLYRGGKIDSGVGPLSDFNRSFTADHGYYETKKITGIPGHTYRLQVRIGDETFQAAAYMPSAPALDSAVAEPDRDMLGAENVYAYFKEPQGEKNYYFMQVTSISQYPYDADGYVDTWGDHSIFPYYVFDDRTLPSYVSHMRMDAIFFDGYAYGGIKPYFILPPEPFQARLMALTKEAYEYFNTLGKQFVDDGNVYKPAPASAAGNISGGALGLFWATGVSYKLVLR